MSLAPMHKAAEDHRSLPALLKRAIADGDLVPGTKLVERELAVKYDFGRTAVRDALRHLAAERIVVLTENRGARVRDLDYAEAADIYDVRAVLEGLAGELFAVRGSVSAKMYFAESLEPVREAIEGSDATATLLASDIFYDCLLAGAGNTELREAVNRLHVRIHQIRRVSLSLKDRAQPTIEALQRIVNAILAGDPVIARMACIEHVRASAAATLPILAAQELGGDGL